MTIKLSKESLVRSRIKHTVHHSTTSLTHLTIAGYQLLTIRTEFGSIATRLMTQDGDMLKSRKPLHTLYWTRTSTASQ